MLLCVCFASLRWAIITVSIFKDRFILCFFLLSRFRWKIMKHLDLTFIETELFWTWTLSCQHINKNFILWVKVFFIGSCSREEEKLFSFKHNKFDRLNRISQHNRIPCTKQKIKPQTRNINEYYISTSLDRQNNAPQHPNSIVGHCLSIDFSSFFCFLIYIFIAIVGGCCCCCVLS